MRLGRLGRGRRGSEPVTGEQTADGAGAGPRAEAQETAPGALAGAAGRAEGKGGDAAEGPDGDVADAAEGADGGNVAGDGDPPTGNGDPPPGDGVLPPGAWPNRYFAATSSRSWRWWVAVGATLALAVAGVAILSVFIYTVFEDEGRDRYDRWAPGRFTHSSDTGWIQPNHKGDNDDGLGRVEGRSRDGDRHRYEFGGGGGESGRDRSGKDAPWRDRGYAHGDRKWADLEWGKEWGHPDWDQWHDKSTDSEWLEGDWAAAPRGRFAGDGCTAAAGPDGGWFEFCYRRGPSGGWSPPDPFGPRGGWFAGPDRAPFGPLGGWSAGPDDGPFGWFGPGGGWFSSPEGGPALPPGGWLGPRADDDDDDHADESPHFGYAPLNPLDDLPEFGLGVGGVGDVLVMLLAELLSDPEDLPELLDGLAELLGEDGLLSGLFGFEGETFEPDGFGGELFGPDGLFGPEGPLSGLFDDLEAEESPASTAGASVRSAVPNAAGLAMQRDGVTVPWPAEFL